MHNQIDTTTPFYAVTMAVAIAAAIYGPNADQPMDHEAQCSHACRILLKALVSLGPDYAETLEALADAESTIDNADLACIYAGAAGLLSILSDQHDALDDMTDPRIERDDRAFLAARRAELL